MQDSFVEFWYLLQPHYTTSPKEHPYTLSLTYCFVGICTYMLVIRWLFFWQSIDSFCQT